MNTFCLLPSDFRFLIFAYRPTSFLKQQEDIADFRLPIADF